MKGGEFIEIRASSRPLQVDGQVVGVLADNTERQQAKEALLQREKEYRTLVEHSPDFIIRYDTELRRTYVNPAWEKISGLSAGEVVNVPATDISGVPKPTADAYLAALKLALKDCSRQEVKFTWVNARDEALHLHYVVLPEFDQNGKVTSLLAIGRDMTERKQAERKIKESEKKFRSLAESLPDNIVRYDREGRTTYVNPALEKTLGFPASEMLGKHIREVNSDSGYRAITASNGRKAVDLFRQHATDIDLVILDIVMPEMRGPEVARLIREINPQVKVMYATGYNDSEDLVSEGEERPVLRKPYTLQQVSKIIRQQLNA